jgi:hypothetical protein
MYRSVIGCTAMSWSEKRNKGWKSKAKDAMSFFIPFLQINWKLPYPGFAFLQKWLVKNAKNAASGFQPDAS